MLLFKKTLFIVEDKPVNRVIYRLCLIQAGATLVLDAFGREVVAKLKAVKKLDLIIPDLKLGARGSGFDVYQEIRKVPALDSIPIIAVSALEEVAEKVREAGFSGFIAQPIKLDSFPEQLRQIITGQTT